MSFNPDFGKPLPRGMTVIGGGWRAEGNSGGKHAGVDIAVPVGTPVFAIQSGVVTSASGTPAGDLGIYAAIAHASGLVSRYLHFSRLDVQPGQRVSKGQQLGLTGNTGNSAAPHLHPHLKAPSSSTVAQVQDAVGVPKGAFEPNVTGPGASVPGEPWFPADRYTADVVATAKAQGIPLYTPRGVPLIVKGLIAAGFLYAAWWLSKEPGGPA